MCIKKNASHKHEITQLKEFVEKWEQIKKIKNDIHEIKNPKIISFKDKQTVPSKKFEFSDSESDDDDYLYDLINDSDDEEDSEEAVKNLTAEEKEIIEKARKQIEDDAKELEIKMKYMEENKIIKSIETIAIPDQETPTVAINGYITLWSRYPSKWDLQDGIDLMKKEKDLIPKEFHIGLSKFFTHEYLKNEMDKLSIQANHQILKLNEDDRKKKCEEFMKESDKILETLQQEYEILCNPKIFIKGSDQSLPQSGGGGGGGGDEASDENDEVQKKEIHEKPKEGKGEADGAKIDQVEEEKVKKELPSDLNTLTVKELKKELKNRSLKMTGNKADLVERLSAFTIKSD